MRVYIDTRKLQSFLMSYIQEKQVSVQYLSNLIQYTALNDLVVIGENKYLDVRIWNRFCDYFGEDTMEQFKL